MKKLILLLAITFATFAAKAQDQLVYKAIAFTYGMVDQITDDIDWAKPKEVDIKVVIYDNILKIHNEAGTVLRQTTKYTQKEDGDDTMITFYAEDEHGLICKVTLSYNKSTQKFTLMVKYSDVAYAFYMKRIQ